LRFVAPLQGQREASHVRRYSRQRVDATVNGPTEHWIERKARIAPVDAFLALKNDGIRSTIADLCVESRRKVRAFLFFPILTKCQIELDASSFVQRCRHSQEKSYCRRITENAQFDYRGHGTGR
jgi:hypothetical protein